MKPKTDTELVDEFCKINNLYDGLEDECNKELVRQMAKDTICFNKYMLRYEFTKLVEEICESNIIFKFLFKRFLK